MRQVALRPRRAFTAFLSVLLVLLTISGVCLTLLPRLARAGAGATATRFSAQARLGYPAGDDWETAVAADRYGHVYTLYKHYDMAGQTSCARSR
jgi:hypothetical protein